MPLSDRARMLIESHPRREYLYRMLQKESGGNPKVVSSTGAAGLWQFTKGTGKLYGLLSGKQDLRKDDYESTKAMIKLTDDNDRTMARMLGRRPIDPELALAHQQGAETGVRMLTGVGKPAAKNLSVNNVNPNLPPQAAAEKVMAYYYPEKLKGMMPGMTLASNPVTPPVNPLLTMPPQAPVIPQTGLTPGPGSPIGGGTIPPPVDVAGLTPGALPAPPPEATAAASVGPLEKLLGADMKGGKGTPFEDLTTGLGDVAKGLNPKVDPQTAAAQAQLTPPTPTPSLGGGGNPQMAASLMQALLQNRQRNLRGLTLTGMP